MRACKMRLSVLVLLFWIIFLTGCGQLEIEDRAFPLALAVTPEEQSGRYQFLFFFEESDAEGSSLYHKEDTSVTAAGYPQAFTILGRRQSGGLDDSHMQVILLSENLLRDEAFLESFYKYFMKEHHFSWNTMVYLLDEHSTDLDALKEGTDGRMGTYLRDMAQSDEQEKTAGVPTLGDLYMEWNNHGEILLLPVLADDEQPSVDHYRLLVQGTCGETITVDDARLLQFLRGDLKKMQLELSDQTIVSLENVRTWRAYVPTSDVWRVTIRMECEAENRLRQSVSEQEQMLRESERILREQIGRVEQWALIKDADGRLVLPEYEIKMVLPE